MGIYEMLAIRQQQMIKKEMESQKKQIDVSSECEDSMGLFPDPITIKINGHPIEIIPIIC